MKHKPVIIAVAGKGGVGKTSVAAAMVNIISEAHPESRLLAIDADPATGLSTALGVEVKETVDDIRKSIVESLDEGDTRTAIELLGDARYKIFDAMTETERFAFIAVGRPEAAGCYCKINGYLKEVISLLSADFESAFSRSMTEDPILDKFIISLSSHAAEFGYEYVIDDGRTKVTGSGTVEMQGDSYIMNGNGIEVYCDGEVRWTVDRTSREVVLESCDADNPDYTANPAALLRHFDDVFSVQSSAVTSSPFITYSSAI